jgi:hypothetical protein
MKKLLKLSIPFFTMAAIIILGGCKKHDENPINETCMKFNPDSVYIEGPVYALKYKGEVILYFPNRNEAEMALDMIKRNSIDEQCKIGQGILTKASGEESYDDDVMYYYLSHGAAPDTETPGEDFLVINPSDVKTKRHHGNWTVVENSILTGGHAMFSFRNDKTACDDAVRVIKKYGFNRECFIGRANASVNYFLKIPLRKNP